MSIALVACGHRTRARDDDAARERDAGPRVADPVEQVAIGPTHVCAVRRSGEVWCWGADGADPARAPARIDGVPASTRVAAGARNSCALDRDGAVWCWGDVAPAKVSLPSPATAISARCAIVAGGTVRCWDTSLGEPSLPAPATALAGGAFHECALLPGHGVWCWGETVRAGMVAGTERATAVVSSPFSEVCAQLDDAAPLCWGGRRPVIPTLVPGLSGSRAIAVGTPDPKGPNVCAIRMDGSIGCVDQWSSTEVRPVGDAAADPWVAIAGGTTWCAIRSSGALFCWGGNRNGELGTATTDRVDAPLLIADPAAVQRADTENDGPICAVDTRGAVMCWPDRTGVPREVRPPPTSADEQIIDMSISEERGCIVRRNGTAECWTDGSKERAGSGLRGGPRDPAPLPGVDDAVAVVSRPTGACVIGRTGSLRCWDTFALRGAAGTTPSEIRDVTDAIDIDFSDEQTCVIRRLGRVWCVAAGSGRASVPIHRTDLVAIALLHNASGCARTKGGDVWCWQGGDDAIPATRLDDLDDVVDLETGDERLCAVTRSGRVACRYPFGPDPGWIPGIDDAIDVLAADRFACVIRRDHQLACWGDLGERRGGGHHSYVAEPTAVLP